MLLGRWDVRPRELRALFNPAFCSMLIRETLKAYQTEDRKKGGMPLPAVYLILPLLLHHATRSSLPRTTRTSLTKWISEHPEIHIGLAGRVSGFFAITSEAMRFGIAIHAIELGNAGWASPRSMGAGLRI